MKRRLWLLLATGLGGCMSTLPPESFAGGSPELRPEVFFAGSTSSSGVLEDRSGAPTRRFHVQGSGTVTPDGIRLDQVFAFEQDAAQSRSWDLHRVDAHRYTGTLSDAVGPVEGEAYGNVVHLRYAMTSPFGGRMEQWLYLQPDGRTVVNEATVTVFGVVVVHLSERITHEDR